MWRTPFRKTGPNTTKSRRRILTGLSRRFDRSGIYLDYLGQEGVGGTPFPYINALYVNSSNDTIVVCRAERAWLVFWFSPAGNLKYKVTIPLTDLPSPDEPGILTTLERIVPRSRGRYPLHKDRHLQRVPGIPERYGIEHRILCLLLLLA